MACTTDVDHLVRHLRPALLALAAAAISLPTAAAAASWNISPRVALGQSWTDNVELSASEFEESEWITELRPGFTMEGEGARAKVKLEYDLQALWFRDNNQYDDTFHQANGTADFVLVPDSLFLDSFARFDQRNIDTSGRVAFSNIFSTDNRTDAFVFGASPYHTGRWGSWGESLVRYQYQGVRYTNTDNSTFDVEDSDTNSILGSIGSPLETRGISWRAGGSYTLTEFDQADEFEFARAALDFGVPVGLRTGLTATIGQESDVEEDSTKGGLDSSFWFVGFTWVPNDRESLKARVGERFFGTAYDFSWQRRGSRGTLSVDYSEEPTTSSGVIGGNESLTPGFSPGGSGDLDTRVFLRKRFSSSATYTLTRSTLEAGIYAERREYQESGSGTERNYGARVSYDWEAAARTRLGATIDWEQREFETDRTDDLGEFTVRLTRELTRTFSAVLRLSHFLRDSDVEDDYNANQVSLFVEARF